MPAGPGCPSGSDVLGERQSFFLQTRRQQDFWTVSSARLWRGHGAGLGLTSIRRGDEKNSPHARSTTPASRPQAQTGPQGASAWLENKNNGRRLDLPIGVNVRSRGAA